MRPDEPAPGSSERAEAVEPIPDWVDRQVAWPPLLAAVVERLPMEAARPNRTRRRWRPKGNRVVVQLASWASSTMTFDGRRM